MDFLKRLLGKKTASSANPSDSKIKVVLKGVQTGGPSPQAAKAKPPRNPVKDTLFGNRPLDQWPPAGGEIKAFPLSSFVEARNHLHAGQVPEAIACWQSIVATPSLEALHYMQAWHFLRQNGVQPPEEESKIIYGVIGEQGATGMLTAVFVDGQARVYSDQGQSIVWNHPDASLDPLIESILVAATALVHKIKGNDPILNVANSSINTLTLLTPSGNYVKTGAPGSLEAMPLIKPVAEELGKMTAALTEKTKKR